MKKLNELNVDDIIYALDKNALSKGVLEFRVLEREDDKIFLDTPDGMHSFKINENDEYTSNFAYICCDRLRQLYFIGTDKKYLLETYKLWLEQSKQYYRNNIDELNLHVKRNKDNLDICNKDLETINKLTL